MALPIFTIRFFLYVALLIFSLVLFGLTAARIHYTTHLPFGDPLNGGVDFYDPVAVELLFTSIVTSFFAIFMLLTLHKRWERGFVSTLLFEVIILAVLWLFWIAGTGVASSIWHDVRHCHIYRPCRVLSALLAFAWLGWITLTALIVFTTFFIFANKAAHEPSHGRWDSNDRSMAFSFRGSRPVSRA